MVYQSENRCKVFILDFGQNSDVVSVNITLTTSGNIPAGYEAGKLLRSLNLKVKQWWYFLLHPEIPPDNNLAERSRTIGYH